MRKNFVNIFANQKNIDITPFDVKTLCGETTLVTDIIIIHFLSKVNKIDKKTSKKIHIFGRLSNLNFFIVLCLRFQLLNELGFFFGGKDSVIKQKLLFFLFEKTDGIAAEYFFVNGFFRISA